MNFWRFNQRNSNLSYLQEDRKYKTLSSIVKDSKAYEFFKPYIDLEKLIISLNPTKSTDQDKLYLFNNILSILDQVQNNKEHLLKYLIQFLVYLIIIRSNQTDLPCYLLALLVLKFEDKQDFIQKAISQAPNCNDFIHSVLSSYGIVNKKFGFSSQSKSPIFSNNEVRKIFQILRVDDIDGLKDYIVTNNIPTDYCISDSKFMKLPIPDSFKTKNGNAYLLDICCFYGSIKCFKFLETNGFESGQKIKELSIAGGNLELIHSIEQKGILFDNCFEISIQYHHHNISDWLLSNYKCETFSLTKCIDYYDYQAYLFFLLNQVDTDITHTFLYFYEQNIFNKLLLQLFIENGIDLNKEFRHCFSTFTLLQYFCNQKTVDLEMIKLLIDNGADVNKGNITPLGYLCQNNQSLNLEAIQLLLDAGANVNAGYISPLGYLFQYRTNVEAIQLLLKYGADVNYGAATPLGFVCKRNIISDKDIEVIKFLIEHGADINKGFATKESYRDSINTSLEAADSPPSYITPLGCLCNHEEINMQAIQLLLENGANINEGAITPLAWFLFAQKNVDRLIIEFFLSKGADINKGEITPICALCNNKEVTIELIDYLINKGADVNGGKVNPLNVVCSQLKDKEDCFIAFHLISKGANIDTNFLKENYMMKLMSISKLSGKYINDLIRQGGGFKLLFQQQVKRNIT